MFEDSFQAVDAAMAAEYGARATQLLNQLLWIPLGVTALGGVFLVLILLKLRKA